MYRIGIVTGQFDIDPTSRDLFEAAKRIAEAGIVDPIMFAVQIDNQRTIKVDKDASANFDALIIRGLNFSGETDFQFEVFEQLHRSGLIIINSPASLQIAESKFLTGYILQENGFRVPESLITQRLNSSFEFLQMYEDIIAKPLYGFQGYGVIRIKQSEADIERRIERLLKEFKCICMQRYIPNPGRDIRSFVVGDKVVASIYRYAKVGRWKTNIRAGASPKACKLTKEQRDMSIQASRCLGLDYTGVDIIEGPDGDYLLEVNGAPAWGGIMEATGRNVAEDIVGHVLHRLQCRAG